MKVSKRFLERAKSSLRKYQRVLESARTRDVNESDTCVIVSDFLGEVLGWDKYSEVTTEFAIRSTFCDLALKLDGRVVFLIEVKSVGTDLKDNHLRQALDYAANAGIEWVLLTNGISWQAHRMRFEQPIASDEVFSLNIFDQSVKPATLFEHLYLISREGASSTDIAKFWQQKEATSRYVIAQLLLDRPALGLLRKSLRKMFPGLRVTEEDLVALLRNEVLKRDVLEGERAGAAEKMVRKVARKRERTKATAPVALPAASTQPSPDLVVAESTSDG